MLRSALPVALFASLVTVACSQEVDDPTAPSSTEPAAEEERGPIGKADHTGQCFVEAKGKKPAESFCGGRSKGNCYCDDWCTFFGDCCTDYEPACLAPSCDPTMICTQVLTCVDGDLYPTGCGADNCDVPIGPCDEEPEGTMCGGFAGFTCAEDEFCKFDGPSCDWADQSGTCQPRPEVCPTHIDPVCGCNGQTYNNSCEAQRAGTDVVAAGPCN